MCEAELFRRPTPCNNNGLTCDSRSQDRYHISRRQIADATETTLRELDLPQPMPQPAGAPVRSPSGSSCFGSNLHFTLLLASVKRH